MQAADVRRAYLSYFTDDQRRHVEIPSALLVPENDPTTLFTGSGMQPLLPYLLGKEHPKGARLVDSQKCFRAEDIEDIGDNRHTTFFEMLGNWSLGDYFKDDQLMWFYTFLTEQLKLDPSRLYVTVFAGDTAANIPRDDESVRVWQSLFARHGIDAATAMMGSGDNGAQRGIHDGERIFYYDAGENWWSRAGSPEDMPAGEPGGPDSEVFFDFGTPHDPSFGPHCHPACDCGRFLEIGNSVFMEYLKQADGTFTNLPKKNVDFGGGLERITAAVNDTPDVFAVDVLRDIIAAVEQTAGVGYEDSNDVRQSCRIIADHVRGAVFMLADGVEPSNTEAGYIARRLLRRSVQRIDALGASEDALHTLVPIVAAAYRDQYPDIAQQEDRIADRIRGEESKFRETLKRGMKQFENVVAGGISGGEAFELFATYGFPLEMTCELAVQRGVRVDTDGFYTAMEEHRRQSREGAQQKFKGGLADHSDMSVKYHTATHLLHQALRDVLGPDVYQKGSNITPERLRFDFAFERKLTDAEIAAVERTVNEKIAAGLDVWHEDVTQETANARNAIGLFEEQYGDTVRLYHIGNAETGKAYSIEFCGGPHVSNTSELAGTFRITKEEAVSAGVRRVKAVLE